MDATRWRGWIDWTTDRTFTAGAHRVPIAQSFHAVYGADAGFAPDTGGVRPSSGRDHLKKTLAWPVEMAGRRLFNTGHYFIHVRFAEWLADVPGTTQTVLEIGCGDMTFARHLPAGQAYNGIDYAISEFQLRRVLRPGSRYNFALAMASDVPVADGAVDVALSVEVFQQIPDLEPVLREVRRILRPGGRFFCSIANTRCRKYEVKGLPWFHRHHFEFDEFAQLVASQGFSIGRTRKEGQWVSLPGPLSRVVVHRPKVSSDDRDNAFFLYEFCAV